MLILEYPTCGYIYIYKAVQTYLGTVQVVKLNELNAIQAKFNN
jgi:hypothetical protein